MIPHLLPINICNHFDLVHHPLWYFEHHPPASLAPCPVATSSGPRQACPGWGTPGKQVQLYLRTYDWVFRRHPRWFIWFLPATHSPCKAGHPAWAAFCSGRQLCSPAPASFHILYTNDMGSQTKTTLDFFCLYLGKLYLGL